MNSFFRIGDFIKSATGTTAINTNNQDNKRAAEESDGAQQPSANKKQRRNKRKQFDGERHLPDFSGSVFILPHIARGPILLIANLT